jgi:hypothetical protein
VSNKGRNKDYEVAKVVKKQNCEKEKKYEDPIQVHSQEDLQTSQAPLGSGETSSFALVRDLPEFVSLACDHLMNLWWAGSKSFLIFPTFLKKDEKQEAEKQSAVARSM